MRYSPWDTAYLPGRAAISKEDGLRTTIDAWHGTTKSFAAFDPDRSETEYGCFFADTPEASMPYADGAGGRVVAAKVDFADPYRCTAAEWHAGTCPDPRDVAHGGIHDGYVIEGLDGTTFIAWRAETMVVVRDAFTFGTPEFDVLRTKAIESGFLEPGDDDDRFESCLLGI
jgi:hypothetical protein